MAWGGNVDEDQGRLIPAMNRCRETNEVVKKKKDDGKGNEEMVGRRS